jgi:hypothetical protein
MKKKLIISLILAVSMVFAANAFAANTSQVTLTSPTIVKTGCEKAGSVTFSFDAGTIITVGDWWYFDLPENVTICSGLNYIISGGNSVNAITYDPANTANAVFGAATDSLADGGAGLELRITNVGPVYGSVSGNAVDANVAIRAGGNMAFLLQGVNGSRRVTITAIGDAAAATLTVQAGYNMLVKILDGAQHAAAAAAGDTMIILDGDADNLFAEGATDVITAAVPAIQNTLCVNAASYTSSLVFVSFASLLDKFTFTGDSQIAHTAAANVISLAACKGETDGEILISAQAACSLDYENDTGYCTTDVFDSQNMPYGNVGGNKFIIQGASTFGDAGDQYEVYIYSDTPGVYFAAAPANISGYLPSQDACGAGVGLLGGANLGPAWTAYNESAAVSAVYSTAGACTHTVRIREVRSAAFTGINTFNQLEVDTPAMAYDTSVVGVGTEVDIRISLRKYPCGEIFSATRTIGSFVTTCSPAAATTTLLYPFLPPLDGSIPGWWGGFLIVNASGAAGTATLTFWEADGDTATLTTASIPAGGQYNPGSMASLLAAVTPAAGNTGTFGDSNVAITVVCNFSMGGGFAFTGNGDEGTGYTAYVAPGSGWN